MNGHMNGHMNEHMNGHINEQMYVPVNEHQMNECHCLVASINLDVILPKNCSPAEILKIT